MKKLTFKTQIRLSLAILILCFILSSVTRQGWIHNLAWIIYGFFFIINPVWPEWADHGDPKQLRRSCRIAGIIAVVVGLITRFGV